MLRKDLNEDDIEGTVESFEPRKSLTYISNDVSTLFCTLTKKNKKSVKNVKKTLIIIYHNLCYVFR